MFGSKKQGKSCIRANPPSAQDEPSRLTGNLPLLVYDGDCGFCLLWVNYWRDLTCRGQPVDYAPYQEVASRFPQIPLEDFQRSVQLIMPDGKVLSGAEAVFRLLAYVPGKGWMLWMYRNVPGFAQVSEWFYALIAEHRSLAYKLTRLLWGDQLKPSSHALTFWLFLRLLGIIYLIAFLSLLVQVDGLIGSGGILPAADLLSSIRRNLGAERYWLFPTLAWLNWSDPFLKFLCLGGALLSMLLILNFLALPVLALLWIFYLSLFTIGQDFLSFQWDILLLEAGFLAIFVGSFQVAPKFPGHNPHPAFVWLFRLLLFRLIFSSGSVKLLSGDPTWRNLTALNYHYFTQPLPNPIAWYAHQLPAWFHKSSVAVMFFIELVVPFFIFAPRRLRMAAAASIALLQALIALTGNYNFFNLLALALCVPLLDDAFVSRFFLRKAGGAAAVTPMARSRIKLCAIASLASLIIFLGVVQLVGMFFGYHNLPKPALAVFRWFYHLRIVNGYGLFAIMTTSRPEIIVEASNDGQTWHQYEFKYKPGDIRRPPPFVAPHQPRLDWQMWFAALGDYSNNPWFVNFMFRLLQGSPKVLALLQKNPFPHAPPRYVRALLYDYKFTDMERRRADGTWWQREFRRVYFPAASLQR